MSTQTKASSGGGRNKGGSNKSSNAAVSAQAETNNNNASAKKQHNDQPKTEKDKPHVKPTAEQIRIAQITEIKSGNEDPKLREKVDQLMETTQRSEPDACLALYECDNDVERAVIYLLEQLEVDALITTSKKKKNRLASSAADGTGDDEFESNNNRENDRGYNNDRDRSRGRGGGSRGGNSRGGSGGGGNFSGGNRGNRQDTRDNDRGGSMVNRSERGGGPRRGGFSSGTRGGRGGRMGPRGQSNRDQNYRGNYRNNNQENNQEIDAWDATQHVSGNNNDIIPNKSEETWGDWDNEEYTGSLSDTKVFTPSTATHGSVSNPSEMSAPPGLEQQILNPPSQQNDVQQYSTTVVSSTATAAAINNGSVQYPELHSASTAAQQLRQALEMPQLGQQTSSLSAEQSQYFNTLSSQNANAYASSVQYQQYDPVTQAPTTARQQQQRPQRARVPPPSKIPSSAVEMPGDNLYGAIDVQFGAMVDFGSGTDDTTSYDNVQDKYGNSTNIDGSHIVTGDMSDYQTKSSGVVKNVQSGLTSGLQASQLIQNTDSISSAQADNLSGNYSQRNPNVASSMNNSMVSGGQSALDQLTKAADPYNQHVNSNASSGAGSGYQNLSYSTGNKSGGYQNSGAQGGYSNTGYNSSQVSATNNYPPSSNTYSSYNQNSYQQPQQNSQQQQNSSVVNNSVVSSNVSNNQNVPVTGSNTNSSYMSNQYPVNQSGFQQNTYQNQSVYGNTGLSNTEYSGSINSLTAKLKGAPGTFDGSSSVVSSVSSAVSNNAAITTSSINSPSLGLTNTKSTTNSTSLKAGTVPVNQGVTGSGVTGATNNTTAASGNGASSNVVQNIPLVSSYIQPNVQFYQQQPYLHFEDMQLVQPRMTTMPGYYEFQTPTSLGAGGVRNDGAAATNLGSVAYPPMSDGRFARTDNNSSPVGNVQSQQTGSGGQMLNMPPYAYFYGANVMPSGFQQYPQIYSQMPATNPNAGQFAKQSYNSGYGSTGYDALNQTAPDYKTGYQSAGVGQQAKGHSVSNNQTGAASDTSSMYSKNHVALNKVNSYDKQSFHSGTPPPFNLAGSQTAGSQTQAYGQHLFIQPMAPHHTMNIHQPIHQMDGSRIANSRRDTNSTGQRQQTNNQSKAGAKPGYSPSYWAAQN